MLNVSYVLMKSSRQRKKLFAMYRLQPLKTPVRSSAQLHKLNPQLSEDELYVVGGRLNEADIAQSMKHPIILPARHPVCKIHIVIKCMFN